MLNSLLFIIFAIAIKRRTELNKKPGPTVDKSGEVKGSLQGSKKTQRSDFVKSTKVSSIAPLCVYNEKPYTMSNVVLFKIL